MYAILWLRTYIHMYVHNTYTGCKLRWAHLALCLHSVQYGYCTYTSYSIPSVGFEHSPIYMWTNNLMFPCTYIRTYVHCRSPLCSDVSEEQFRAEVMGRIPNQVSITSTEAMFSIWCEEPGNDGLGSHSHVCTLVQ